MSNVRTSLPSGAEAGVVALGDPAAHRIVVLCHPTPGAADFDPDPVVTTRWGVHVVALDRPGYGASPALDAGTDASMTARADDVAAFVRRVESNADRVSDAELTRFGVVGWGTGGLLAAAIAARHPGRVDCLAMIDTPAPDRAEATARRALATGCTLEALGVAPGDPDLERGMGLRRRLDRMLESAALQGDAGIRGDVVLLADRGWLAGLGAVTAATHIWLGTDDLSIAEDDPVWPEDS